MKLNEVESHYRKFYETIDFERVGLFECARDAFGERDVIYLGSSTHIAPSYVFPNVTYVDNNDRVKEFFRNNFVVTDFVEKRKRYKRKANISFVDLDYTKCEYPDQYDLIIAIFSPGSFVVAKKFMKKEALFLYLSLPSEKNVHQNLCGLERVGEIQVMKGKYRYSEKMIENAYSKNDMIDNKFKDVYAYSVWKLGLGT